jgi:beta-glucosidase/6-phospho-beta-glucosidase/beta-galactosidase
VVDNLLAFGINPVVTLYHWDLPQALDDLYMGWLSDEIVQDFAEYADACFSAFGDRVKYWLTFNEPLTFCPLGYGTGSHAPGRCSSVLPTKSASEIFSRLTLSYAVTEVIVFPETLQRSPGSAVITF